MVFDQIEQLKQQYTDKYVVVDESRPELRRFRGQTGTVRTVNMSGRALVEFDANENTGWYDIELDFLKVIDQPLEKPEPAAKKTPAKPAAKKPAAPATKPASGGMSVADMLAAARGEKGGTGSVAKTASAAKPDPPAPSAAKNPAAMSVEEMLAAARGEKSGNAPTEAAVTSAPAEEATPPPAASKPEVTETESAQLPTSVEDIVAFCRKADG